LAINHVNMREEPTLSIMIYTECTSDNGQFITSYRNNESLTVTNDQRIARLNVQIFQTKVSHLDGLHSVKLRKNSKWKDEASFPSVCLEKMWRAKKPRINPWWWEKKWYVKHRLFQATDRLIAWEFCIRTTLSGETCRTELHPVPPECETESSSQFSLCFVHYNLLILFCQAQVVSSSKNVIIQCICTDNMAGTGRSVNSQKTRDIK
jgi:hypothetical protein